MNGLTRRQVMAALGCCYEQVTRLHAAGRLPLVGTAPGGPKLRINLYCPAAVRALAAAPAMKRSRGRGSGKRSVFGDRPDPACPIEAVRLSGALLTAADRRELERRRAKYGRVA